MDLEFLMLIILAGWVGVCEWRIHRLEKKLEKDSQ